MKTCVGITCADSLVGHSIIRCLRKSDLSGSLEIIGFDYFENSLASYWTDKYYVMPDILKKGASPESYLKKLKSHIDAHKIKILFVGMGFELKMLSSFRNEVKNDTGCSILVSGENVISICEDKYLTNKFLRNNSIPCPETWLPGEIAKVRYPAVIKPRSGSGSRGMSVVNNRKELESVLRFVKNPVIQQNIGSMEREYTCGVLYFDGKVRTSICLRRTLRHGNTYAAFNSPDTPHNICDYVGNLADRLKPFGPCNFQLRIDEDGTPKLFEINARFSGTTHVRTFFGINEPEYAVKYLLEKQGPVFSQKYGRVFRYLEEFFVEDK